MPSTKLLHTVHKWTGLISGLNIVLLSLTGAYIVFMDDINGAIAANQGELVASVDPDGDTPMQDAVDALLARQPGTMAMRFREDEHFDNQYQIVLRSPNEMLRYTLDPVTGDVRAYQDSLTVKVNDFVFRLHANLLLGSIGTLVLGAVALLFLVSTVTGIFIYAPFMKQLAYGTFRRNAGLRRASSDLHKLVGVSSLGFNLLMAITGVALTLGLVGVQLWSKATIQSRTAHAIEASGTRSPPIDAVWAAAARAHPEAPVNNVAYPGGYQGKNYYLVFHTTQGVVSSHIPTLSLVPVAEPSAAEPLLMPWWVKAIMACFPLHFGNFAGFGLKIVYSVFGLSSGLLTLSGSLLTLTRWGRRLRARQRRSVPTPATAPERAFAHNTTEH